MVSTCEEGAREGGPRSVLYSTKATMCWWKVACGLALVLEFLSVLPRREGDQESKAGVGSVRKTATEAATVLTTGVCHGIDLHAAVLLQSWQDPQPSQAIAGRKALEPSISDHIQQPARRLRQHPVTALDVASPLPGACVVYWSCSVVLHKVQLRVRIFACTQAQQTEQRNTRKL